jgi:hypothetical protein
MSEQPPSSGAGEDAVQELPSVPDVLLSSAHLLITLAADSIARRERLAEAELAIEALRAQLPVLERVLPAEAITGYRQALADLQMAFADAVAGPPARAGGEERPTDDASQPAQPRPAIWTPGGAV